MTSGMSSAEGKTGSVCPVCLKTIPAERVVTAAGAILVKECPEHGRFETVLWRGAPDINGWYRVKNSSPPEKFSTEVNHGCPHDCGLCPDHRQQSCCVLVEITSRCNLNCPVCFADSGTESGSDPSLDELDDSFAELRRIAGGCNIQLSGGEPTVRDDCPDIIALAARHEFSYIQLNSNGIRLAEDRIFCREIGKAGLSSLFLQFDGTDDSIYRKLRGRDLFDMKCQAIENCAEAGIGVVLVPTLVPGVNTGHLGKIIDFALDRLPAVRAVHFQPISYFGRYPEAPLDRDRFTLPEVIRAIEEQTGGSMKAGNFSPGGCEHSLCSFHGDFIIGEDGQLSPLTHDGHGECCSRPAGGVPAVTAKRAFVRKRWAVPKDRRKLQSADCCGGELKSQPTLDAFLDRLHSRRISISCMAFQDSWNLDLERLRDCCLHIFSNGKLHPFCAYNLSGSRGDFLYRRGEEG